MAGGEILLVGGRELHGAARWRLFEIVHRPPPWGWEMQGTHTYTWHSHYGPAHW